MAHRHVKQPAEVVTLAVDFARVLAAGEAVSSGTVTAADGEGQDVTADLLPDGEALSGPRLQARVAGGTDGARYTLTFRATTSAGHVYEEEVTLLVKEL